MRRFLCIVALFFVASADNVRVTNVDNLMINQTMGKVILVGDYFNCSNLTTQSFTNYSVMYNDKMREVVCPLDDIGGDPTEYLLSYTEFFRKRKAPSFYNLYSCEHFNVDLFISSRSEFMADILDLHYSMLTRKVLTKKITFYILLVNNFTFNNHSYNYNLFNEMVTSGQILGIVPMSEFDQTITIQNLFILSQQAPFDISVTRMGTSSATFNVKIGNTTQNYVYDPKRPVEFDHVVCYSDCSVARERGGICVENLETMLYSEKAYRHFVLYESAYVDGSSNYISSFGNRYRRSPESMPMNASASYPEWFGEWLKFNYYTEEKEIDWMPPNNFGAFIDVSNPYNVNGYKLKLTDANNNSLALTNFYRCYQLIDTTSDGSGRCYRLNIRVTAP